MKNYKKKHENINDTSTINIFQIIIRNQTDVSRRSPKIFKKTFKKIFNKTIISTSKINLTTLNVQTFITSLKTSRQYFQIVISMSRRLKISKFIIKATILKIVETILNVVIKTVSKAVEIISKIPNIIIILRRNKIADN